MKGLSLTQPWASLVAFGEKTIETRSWQTRYRGPVAIQAAKAFPRDAMEACHHEPFRSVLAKHGQRVATLPRSAIVCVVDLIDCVPFTDPVPKLPLIRRAGELVPLGEHELAFGDFSAGRFGFVFANVRRLNEPLPFSGALGLWGLLPHAESLVRLRTVRV